MKPSQEGFTRTSTVLGSWQGVVNLDYSTTQHSGESASEQKWLSLETQKQRIEDCCEVCTIEVEVFVLQRNQKKNE